MDEYKKLGQAGFARHGAGFNVGPVDAVRIEYIAVNGAPHRDVFYKINYTFYPAAAVVFDKKELINLL